MASSKKTGCYINWPQLCVETLFEVKKMVLVAYLDRKQDVLRAYKERFPNLFCDTQIETLAPFSFFADCDKERFVGALGMSLIGVLDAIALWEVVTKRLDMPKSLCLEGEETGPTYPSNLSDRKWASE